VQFRTPKPLLKSLSQCIRLCDRVNSVRGAIGKVQSFSLQRQSKWHTQRRTGCPIGSYPPLDLGDSEMPLSQSLVTEAYDDRRNDLFYW